MTWGRARDKGPTPAPEARTDGSWWAQLPQESAAEWRARFVGQAQTLMPAMSDGHIGRLSGKPTLGPDSTTTMQTNRWVRQGKAS